MVINFTRSKDNPEEIVIDGSKFQRLEYYKYLGVVFDNELIYSQNINKIVKKIAQGDVNISSHLTFFKI